MQEKMTKPEEWPCVMVMEPARAILIVFYQNKAGTEGQGDAQEDSGLSSWKHVVSADVLSILETVQRRGQCGH